MALKCCDITAGRLRHPIIIERKVRVADGAGGESVTWSVINNLKASIDPVSGSERFHSQRIQASITHRVLFRWFDGFRSSDRINFNGRFFNVVFIRNLEERNRYFEVSAIEGVAQ